jgi:anti-sigma factor RsiW
MSGREKRADESVPEITCREVVELVSDYLEGRLAAGDRARFESHLTECPGCVAYIDQIRFTVAAAGRLREDALDRRFREELVTAFRDWRSASRPAGPV